MIRDTNRLLSRPNLPADLRREQERKLSALQVTLTDRQKAEVEREMSVKYRMVKFFERKKALRRLAVAQAKADPVAVSEAQLDLAYILHFPKDRKYISLYQTSNSAETVTERETIRKQISEKLALLGAETMLAKVTESKKHLKGSDDEEEEEESDEEESDEEGSEEEGSDNEEDGDSEDGSDDEGDELSYDESEEDSEDNDLSDDEDLDSDKEDMDSDDDDEEDDDDDDDMDSEDDEEDSEAGSEEDSEEGDSDDESDEEEESEEEDDSDAPKPKKGRH